MPRLAAIAALCLALALAARVQGLGVNCGADGSSLKRRDADQLPPVTQVPQGGVKVAYFGDQGVQSSLLGQHAKDVLALVKGWGADFIVHQGDFDYQSSPKTWYDNIDAVLGPSYPYFASIGNHDVLSYGGSTGYQQRMINRLALFNATNNCAGDYGTNMVCHYKGIAFVLSGVGTRGSGHAQYIDNVFTAYRESPWKVCTWHKNQRLYQTGDKTDETGYEVYDTCRKHGAMIATGHEHSYSRTHVMSNFASQTVASTANNIELVPGQTIAFVAGVGGVGIRPWKNNLEKNPWWAATASSDNGLSDGAVLCTYQKNTAACEFRDRAGKVWDTWTMSSNPAAAQEFVAESAIEQCQIPFLEYQVSASEDDVQEDLTAGGLICSNKELRVTSDMDASEHKLRTGLRFRNVQLPRNAKVLTAHLQLYGRVQGKNEKPVAIQIHGENGAAAPFACSDAAAATLADRAMTKSSALWTEDADGWEELEVWTSPELKTIVEEIASSESWRQGADLALVLEGLGESRSAMSFDGHSCAAPSLVIELASDCASASVPLRVQL